MSTITVYDSVPQSHCGCGTDHHAELTTFKFEAAAIRAAGGTVNHHNFEEEPMAFMASPIGTFVADKGVHRLPAVAVDGKIVLHGRYPKREEMAEWAGLSEGELATLVAIPQETLPMAGHASLDACDCGGDHSKCDCGHH
ncbi:MAG TPA: arsenic metallochaperone ArsD family protein [Corynebacteriales bacterium]|nr:arsenic metallochaperone ArsD family protein [Mycobacteriales bacterium]